MLMLTRNIESDKNESNVIEKMGDKKLDKEFDRKQNKTTVKYNKRKDKI